MFFNSCSFCEHRQWNFHFLRLVVQNTFLPAFIETNSLLNFFIALSNLQCKLARTTSRRKVCSAGNWVNSTAIEFVSNKCANKFTCQWECKDVVSVPAPSTPPKTYNWKIFNPRKSVIGLFPANETDFLFCRFSQYTQNLTGLAKLNFTRTNVWGTINWVKQLVLSQTAS